MEKCHFKRNFTKSKVPPWLFIIFLKLHKWYQNSAINNNGHKPFSKYAIETLQHWYLSFDTVKIKLVVQLSKTLR